MNRVIDWVIDTWSSVFATQRARIVLAIALLLYFVMLLIFGGSVALVIGIGFLFYVPFIGILIVGFVSWVIHGND